MIWTVLACLRALVMSILYLPFLLVMSGLEVILNILFNNRRVDNFMIKTWGRASCWMFGVHVKVLGRENVPKGGGLFLFNHASFFDIFALSSTIPGLRFGAKIELFSIPLFGLAMKRTGMLPIDRSNRERVYNIYRDAEERMKRGERFALAPEGTRQTEEKIGSFKAGPFVFAINSHAPVIPVVIRGASKILPKHSIFPNWGVWSRTIEIEFLPPTNAAQFSIEKRGELQRIIHDQMSRALPGPA